MIIINYCTAEREREREDVCTMQRVSVLMLILSVGTALVVGGVSDSSEETTVAGTDCEEYVHKVVAFSSQYGTPK